MAIPINLPDTSDTQDKVTLDNVNELKKRLDHPTYQMLKPAPLGYVPIPTNVPGEIEGSVFNAALEDTTTWGSFIASPNAQKLDPSQQISPEESLSLIPDDLVLDYADRYIGRDPKDYEHITDAIRHEISNDALLSAHPWKTLGWSVALGFTDPVNYLPFGVIYKNVKRGSALLRGVSQSGAAAAGSTAVGEAIIQRNQLTREAQESYMNTFAAGIVGGALGGIGTGIGIHLNAARKAEIETRQKMTAEVRDVLTDTDKELDPNGLLKDEDLARMPAIIRKSMILTPMNRLINSRFGISKYFGNRMYEHNYTLVKHTEGLTDGAAVERLIKGRMQEHAKTMIDYQNIYFEMAGIDKGPFKGTRAKLSAPEYSVEQFGNEVSLVLTTERPSPNEHVNRAARILRENIFDPLKDEAIALGLLPEDVSVPNAANYFMTAYNKNKIIEQGGRSERGSGTFPNALYQDFKASQEILKQHKQTPEFISATNEINVIQEKLKGIRGEEKLKLDKQITSLNKEIRKLESLKAKRAPEQIKTVNAQIKDLSKKRTNTSNQIKDLSKKFKASLDQEIQAFNKTKTSKQKEMSRLNQEISKLKTRLKDYRLRRDTLKERLKKTGENTKSYQNILNELSKLPSVITETDKNIKKFTKDLRKVGNELTRINDSIKRNQSNKKNLPKEITGLQKIVADLDKNIYKLKESRKPSEKEIRALEKDIRKLEEQRKEIEESKTLSKKERKELETRIDELEQSIVDNAPPRAKNYKGELHKEVSDDMLWTQVEQTVDNILGDNAGQLLNPILSNLKGMGGTKPLKARHILADQESMREWHITDASKVASMYTNALVPTIELTRFAQNFGVKDIGEMRTKFGKNILEEYNAQAEGLTGKAAQKLREERDRDISDMNTTLDLLLGIYGDGPNVLNSSARNLYQNFLKWNYTRLLGYMTLSSIPDAGIQVFANGPYRLVHDGLLKMFSQAKKVSKRDLNAIGYGLETELGTRIKSYAEHEGLSTNPGPFTRGLDALTHAFGNLSLMNQWNTVNQNIAGHVSINRTLDVIHRVVNGQKVSQKEIERVYRLGVSRDHFETIADFTKDNISDGTRFADWTNWDITTPEQAEALKQFQLSVGKDVDSIVIVPGLGDRVKIGSLDANTPVGKLLFQFKTFLSSATNKLLYSGIQRRNDINVYLGAVSMLALGGLSYITTSLVRGSEPDLSFTNLAHESIDKSGLLGIWGETANIGSKLLGFGGVSRYQSRDIWGALTGPTGGALSEILSIMNKVRAVTTNDETLNTKDAEKIARLIPLQNLAWWHAPRRKLIHETAVSLGAEDVGMP